MSDFPTNPLNLLADVNAVLGYYFVHLHPFDVTTAKLQGQSQDSTYCLIPTTTLPLLTPIAQIPGVGPLISALLGPPLRVLIESAYDRSINPGTPTPAQWLYSPNPLATAINCLKAMPVGWDNAIADVTGSPANRPFKTQPEPTYGVGGPSVNAGVIDPYGAPTPYPTPSAAARTASAPSALSTGAVSLHPAGTATVRPAADTSAPPPGTRLGHPIQRSRRRPSRRVTGGRTTTPTGRHSTETPTHPPEPAIRASVATGEN